jgi:hypothetical protein
MVQKGGKTAADAARIFNIHPATVCRLLARDSCSHNFLIGCTANMCHPDIRVVFLAIPIG